MALFGQEVSEEKIFLTLANQKQELSLAAIFDGRMGRNEEMYRGPYIDAFCQVWFHLVQLFQRSRLKYEKLTDGRQVMAIPLGIVKKIILNVYMYDFFDLKHILKIILQQ